ncbi:MAG: PQQ-dependent sugar dehydrogenase [Pseudobacteriovorax sp.]|nr:PQQ-dependent sugar dehydrogenase [Pseudobacteriovorax sp.]
MIPYSKKIHHPKVGLVILLFVCNVLHARDSQSIGEFESDGLQLKLETVLNYKGVIWGFDFLGPADLIFTKRSGQFYRYNIDTKSLIKIEGGPKVSASGEGGLLDIRLHPRFYKNNRLFFSYVKKMPQGTSTTLATARLIGNTLTELKDLFISQPAQYEPTHFGSRVLVIGNYLYLSTGDRGVRENSQKLDNHHGKIIRLKIDGTVPDDNPFVNQKDVKPEIWSFGHRNIQGLAYDSIGKRLWAQEHGPDGGDEINLISRGANYGWPVITHGKEYSGKSIGVGRSKKGMKQPVKQFTPSIAPSGLIIYTGNALPNWKAHVFSGALRGMHLNKLKLNKNVVVDEQRLLADFGLRIRCVRQGPDGLIYLSTDNGKILKISKR